MPNSDIASVMTHLLKQSGEHATNLSDLASTVIIQNTLLMALIRSHPNKDILETNLQDAIDRFSADADITDEKTPLASATLKGFKIALQAPLKKGPEG